jgi:ubiquinone/menaquinone biosynthesis C-methylase UbiE
MEHQGKVEQQFGAQAQAYLGSTVHAQGADLQQLAALAAAQAEGRARILDLGCGAGHASFAVAPHAASVTAYDLSADMLGVVAEAARVRGLDTIRTRQGPAERLPFADAEFDLVISRYSAHHWSDPAAALAEAARVLHPDGILCIIDVVGPEGPHTALLDTHLQAVELLRDVSHVRDYAPREWLTMLHNAGLTAEETRRWRIDIEFASWLARMRTPAALESALRQLWAGAPDEVRRHYAVTATLDFQLEAAMFTARHPAVGNASA